MIAVGKTDIGLIRSQNQDSIFISENCIGSLPNVFIVADGMGGHKAGDVASQTAIKCFCEYAGKAKDEILDTLIGAVQYANTGVYNLSKSNEDYVGMGTTFVVATVDDKNLYIAHVGDSRLYRIRNNEIIQLTNDHSLVNDMLKSGDITAEEAADYPYKNIITRAVGIDESVVVDGIVEQNADDDILLLCSDGLSGMVSKEEILDIILDKSMSLEEKADRLIDRAKNYGGRDNISVVLVTIGGADR